MDLLAIFTLASLIGAFMLVRVIFWTTNRAAESAVTQYFRASEHILETGEPPPEWLVPPFRRRLFSRAPAAATPEEIHGRFKELLRFFENCSFFEDEWTREQLLSQLKAVREKWTASHSA